MTPESVPGRFAGVLARPGAPLASAAVLACGVATFVAMARAEDVVGITSVLVAAWIVALLGWRTPAVRGPLMLAFGLRSLASLVQAYLMELPGAGLDAVGFENIGWAWAQTTWSGLMGNFISGALLYSWIIAVMYWVAGRSVLMVQTLNVLLGTLVVYNVFLLARMIWGEAAARRAAWIAAAFPTLVLFSAITLREQMVGYPLTLGALWIARWRQTDRVGWLAAAVMAFTVALAFHTVIAGAVLYVIFAVLARGIGALRRGQVGASLKAVIGLGTVVALIALVLLTGWGASDPRWWIERLTSLDQVRGHQAGGYVDRTDYLTWLVTRNPADVVWQAPIRLFFFLFMPFPWLVSAVVDLVGLLDAMLYAWLAWHFRRVFREVWRTPHARAVFGLMMSVMLIFALVVSNYGTAIRHRGKVAPLLVALAAGSLVRGRQAGGDPAPRAVLS